MSNYIYASGRHLQLSQFFGHFPLVFSTRGFGLEYRPAGGLHAKRLILQLLAALYALTPTRRCVRLRRAILWDAMLTLTSNVAAEIA